jgi:hypothetical protein
MEDRRFPKTGVVAVVLSIWIAANLAGTVWGLAHRPVHDLSDSAYYFQKGREIAAGQWGTESIVASHLVRHASPSCRQARDGWPAIRS